MENFLRQIDLGYGRRSASDDGFITVVGHLCKDLRAWGVLDSVLRMVQATKDLFAQPERLVSYFVSPAPPIGDIRRGLDFVSFVLPVSEVQFPLVTSYLRAALEALPTYINKPMASVKWDNSRVHISWSENQSSLFDGGQPPELSLHPELVRNILVNLESSQKQLEEMKLEILDKNRQIVELTRRLSEAATVHAVQPNSAAEDGGANGSPEFHGLDPQSRGLPLSRVVEALDRELSGPVGRALTDLYRIGDYLARGQQLITLLIGQGLQTPQVQEAMRRVDWPHVADEGPQVVRRAVQGLQKMQSAIQDLHLLAAAPSSAGGSEESERSSGETPTSEAAVSALASIEESRVPSDLNKVIERAVQAVRREVEHKAPDRSMAIQIDQHLLLDRRVCVNPRRMEQAVFNLLNNAIEALPAGGRIRVMARPKGRRAEIEISDTGIGMDATTLARASEPFFTTKTESAAGLGLSVARSIVKMHEGSLTLESRPGHGSTVVIDLPLTN